MSNKLDLVNQALVKLGQKKLTSLLDTTPPVAVSAATIVDDVVRYVITDGAFTSCIRRQSLNVTTETPVYDYSYEYQLPTNPKCLRVLSINESECSPKTGYIDYVVEGDKLYTNESSVKIKYLADITDTGSFDPALNRAIVARLMADLSLSIGISATMCEALEKKANAELANAKSIDGQQGSNRDLYSDDLIDIR